MLGCKTGLLAREIGEGGVFTSMKSDIMGPVIGVSGSKWSLAAASLSEIHLPTEITERNTTVPPSSGTSRAAAPRPGSSQARMHNRDSWIERER
jgi:hypothetical protein